jgi:hypothetical protein
MTDLAIARSGRDLLPGDPEVLDGLVAQFGALGTGLADAVSQLGRLDAGAWIGPAADAFGRLIADEPARYGRAAESFATAAAAVRAYADALRRAQTAADRAIAEWQEAESRSTDWRAARQSDPTLTADPGDAGRHAAERLILAARVDLDAEAQALAAILNRAGEDAPDGPGLWGSLWEGFSDFWEGAWDATLGGLVALIADLDDPLALIDDAWDNLYDHFAAWNWSAFLETWEDDFQDFVAWEEWDRGDWERALGSIAGEVALILATAGIGRVALRILRRRHDIPGDADGDGDGTGGGSDRLTPDQARQRHPVPASVGSYERIHRTAGSDRHILGGDGYSNGGHRAGTGFPENTEFPEGWSDQQILDTVDQAVQNPEQAWQMRETDGRRIQYSTIGEANGLRVRIAISDQGRIVSAYPLEGQPGVYINPASPPSPPGGSRPIWTREAPDGWLDGYWTWRTASGTPVFTDGSGQLLLLDARGRPILPTVVTTTGTTVPSGS